VLPNSKATPHHLTREDWEENFCQNKAENHRNTLCISRFDNDVMAEIFHKTPQTQWCGVASIKGKEPFSMDKYVCDVCGWVYDPEEGLPELDIDPGTPFEDLPDDFECPMCAVGKDQFSKADD
jgi:rubredoxin-NAD+ reductase